MATSNRATVPVLTDEKSYSNWKKEIAIWLLAPTFPEEKQAAAIFLTLTGRAREAALEMSTDDIGSKEGGKGPLAKLDELYQVDKNQSVFLAYEEFEQFERQHDMNMKDYINTFDRLNNRLIEHDIKLPEGVLVFRLLKGTNLSPDTENWVEQL